MGSSDTLASRDQTTRDFGTQMYTLAVSTSPVERELADAEMCESDCETLHSDSDDAYVSFRVYTVYTIHTLIAWTVALEIFIMFWVMCTLSLSIFTGRPVGPR